MGKENTLSKWIKLDVDEFKLKQEFLQRFFGPQPLPSNKAKKVAVCKRRMANKHKEHNHHKLVGY